MAQIRTDGYRVFETICGTGVPACSAADIQDPAAGFDV
jgi:hypothetical protein